MSKTINCPRCGQPMDVPAYPGDGVYTTHYCDGEDSWRDPDQLELAPEQPPRRRRRDRT